MRAVDVGGSSANRERPMRTHRGCSSVDRVLVVYRTACTAKAPTTRLRNACRNASGWWTAPPETAALPRRGPPFCEWPRPCALRERIPRNPSEESLALLESLIWKKASFFLDAMPRYGRGGARNLHCVFRFQAAHPSQTVNLTINTFREAGCSRSTVCARHFVHQQR